MKKYLITTILFIMLITTMTLTIYAENELTNVKAKIIENKGIEEIQEENEPTKRVQNLLVRILEGEYEDEEYEMVYLISKDIEDVATNMELKENNNILVSLEEKDGEVTNITYVKTIESSYILYIIGAVLILVLLIISRKRATIIYFATIILSVGIIIFSIQNGWNLILISSILSLLITTILFISLNKINKEPAIMLIRAILAIAVSGILTYLLFDIMNLESINIKIADKLVNIKDLICSATILFSCGIYNAIAISAQYIFYSTNKPYKTKSDNIIEGQRSLKL